MFWLCCPKDDHFDEGKQQIRELYEIGCGICLNKADDAVDLVHTPCGKF
jgi:Pyruvate/2-oxoacid:ferredoxin oxidoreductase delta subunit